MLASCVDQHGPINQVLGPSQRNNWPYWQKQQTFAEPGAWLAQNRHAWEN
jgi:poly(3-hydroxyalkanoate) synthetase